MKSIGVAALLCALLVAGDRTWGFEELSDEETNLAARPASTDYLTLGNPEMDGTAPKRPEAAGLDGPLYGCGGCQMGYIGCGYAFELCAKRACRAPRCPHCGFREGGLLCNACCHRRAADCCGCAADVCACPAIDCRGADGCGGRPVHRWFSRCQGDCQAACDGCWDGMASSNGAEMIEPPAAPDVNAPPVPLEEPAPSPSQEDSAGNN